MPPPLGTSSADVRINIASAHSSLVHQICTSLQIIRRKGHVEVDGESLDVPTVVAVSRYVGLGTDADRS